MNQKFKERDLVKGELYKVNFKLTLDVEYESRCCYSSLEELIENLNTIKTFNNKLLKTNSIVFVLDIFLCKDIVYDKEKKSKHIAHVLVCVVKNKKWYVPINQYDTFSKVSK